MIDPAAVDICIFLFCPSHVSLPLLQDTAILTRLLLTTIHHLVIDYWLSNNWILDKICLHMQITIIPQWVIVRIDKVLKSNRPKNRIGCSGRITSWFMIWLLFDVLTMASNSSWLSIFLRLGISFLLVFIHVELGRLQPMLVRSGRLTPQSARSLLRAIFYFFLFSYFVAPSCAQCLQVKKKLYFLNRVSKLNFDCTTVFLIINPWSEDPTWVYLEKKIIYIYTMEHHKIHRRTSY